MASVDPSGNTLAVNGTGVIDSSGRYFGYFDTNFNLYLRDTCLGVASSCTPTSTLIGNFSGPSSQGYLVYTGLWISPDAAYISFLQNVYETMTYSGQTDVVETCLGLSSCTPGTVVTTVPNTKGAFMALEGRYLSYGTGNSMATGPTGADIYDTCYGAPLGCTPQNVASPVSTTNSDVPISSADGRYLVYQNTSSQIVLHDSCLGAAPGCSPSDTTVSNTSLVCGAPTISPDAQYIAWTCAQADSPLGTGYVQATCFGSPSGCSTIPSIFSSSVQGAVSLSNGGRFIAYQGLLNGLTEIYLYHSCNGISSGCAPQTVPVSVNSSDAAANGNCTLVGMSSNGQYVLFQSSATNLTTLPAGFDTNLTAAYIALSPIF